MEPTSLYNLNSLAIRFHQLNDALRYYTNHENKIINSYDLSNFIIDNLTLEMMDIKNEIERIMKNQTKKETLPSKY